MANINYAEPKTIATEIRNYVKKNFPSCKFSVTVKNFNVITIALMSAPFEAFTESAKQEAEENGCTLGGGSYCSNRLTAEAAEVMNAVTVFVNSLNYDNSDPYTDYFDCGFYAHVNIGKWDKPFTVLPAPQKRKKLTEKEWKKQLEAKAAFEAAEKAAERAAIENRFEVGAKLSDGTTIAKIMDEFEDYLYIITSVGEYYDANDFTGGVIAFEEIPEQPDENQLTFDDVTTYSVNNTAAATTVSASPIDETAAKRGHEAYSFNDYKAGSATAAYNATVGDVRAAAEEIRERIPDECRGELDKLVNRYAEKLADWTNRKNRADAYCPSWFITGAANYPHRKHEKQMQQLDRLYKEYSTIEGLENRIRNFEYEIKRRPIKAGDASAADKLRAKVEELTALQEKMKRNNAEARKCGEAAPYAAWALSNNRQNLKRYSDRLAALEKAKAEPTEQSDHIQGEGFRVVRNTEIMRLQFLFDGKPDEQTRTLLKSNGFRWAPSQMAWQRQLTANAERAARTVAEAIR